MIFGWFKRIFRRDSQKKANFVSTFPQIRVEQREPRKEELALGWASGYDEKSDEPIYQLKGIEQKIGRAHV